jgi:hypothetical protein
MTKFCDGCYPNGNCCFNAKGQTIHATFNCNLDGKPQSAQPTIKDIEYFVGLRMLIIEEVSTSAQAILGSMDALLR